MSRLLDPKTLMAIKDLSLVAKTTIDGFMLGIHKSRVKGPGLEFSQYRSYQAGDDLRWLDWKMYARSDRYYIRESEIETSISIRFLVDASRSMNHKDGGFAKIEYARWLCASLAYLANLQGDSIGLYIFQDGEVFQMPSRKDLQHLARFYYQLEHIEPSGKFSDPIHYKNIFAGIQKRELLIFVTDYYEEGDEISELLESLSSLGHEIIVFHIVGRNELEFDFGKYSTLEDLETGRVISIDEHINKEAYKQRIQDHFANIRMKLLNRHIVYRLLAMDQPLDKALRDFLNQRQKSGI
jgi:uncharacterized protein (DUF58 family)